MLQLVDGCYPLSVFFVFCVLFCFVFVCFGIYRLLYDPDKNGNELDQEVYSDGYGIIESLRDIWIFRGVGIWSLSILMAAIPFFWLKFWQFFRRKYGTTHYERALLEGQCSIIMKGCIWFCVCLIIWLFSTFIGIICCELIVFSPFAFVMWYTRHRPFIEYVSVDLVSKKLFDFIFYNRALNTRLEKFEIIDKNGGKISQQLYYNQNKKRMSYRYQPENLKSKKKKDIVKNYKLSDKNRKQLIVNQKERMFRLLLLNYCCIKYLEYTRDEKLMIFLTSHISTDWKNIEFEQLRDNCDNPSCARLFRGMFWSWLSFCRVA